MNITEMRQRVNKLNSAVAIANMRMEGAIKAEQKRKHIAELAAESGALVAHLERLVENLKILNSVVGKEEVDFKRRRLEFLENSISGWMDYIFPRKKLRAKIACNFDRRKMKLRLNIVDPAGNVRPPAKTEGSFAQQLISVAAAHGCTKLLGKNILYMDEPVSKSSPDNLIKLQKLLKQFVEEGFQIILISQSDLLFADVERRLILLRSTDGLFVDGVTHQDINHLERE